MRFITLMQVLLRNGMGSETLLKLCELLTERSCKVSMCTMAPQDPRNFPDGGVPVSASNFLSPRMHV